MTITPEERKEIQKILEEFVKGQPSFNDRRFALTILSFIYELNQQNPSVTTSGNDGECNNKDGVCIWQHLRQLAMLKVPEALDETYLNAFAELAQKLNGLACVVNTLSKTLHRRYAERLPSKIPPGVITQ